MRHLWNWPEHEPPNSKQWFWHKQNPTNHVVPQSEHDTDICCSVWLGKDALCNFIIKRFFKESDFIQHWSVRQDLEIERSLPHLQSLLKKRIFYFFFFLHSLVICFAVVRFCRNLIKNIWLHSLDVDLLCPVHRNLLFWWPAKNWIRKSKKCCTFKVTQM